MCLPILRQNKSAVKNFTHRLTVRSGDIDDLGHANNVVYVRWVQEVAEAHWKTVASEALRSRYAWVVLRHEIDYRAPVFEGDVIVGKTWVGEHKGAKFERFVKLSAQNTGKVVAEARTLWCMLDAATGRPQRIGQEVLEIL